MDSPEDSYGQRGAMLRGAGRISMAGKAPFYDVRMRLL